MQQGIQANIGILQRQRQLDIAEYAQTIRDTDSMLGMINQGAIEYFSGRQQQRKQNRASGSELDTGLDPTRNRHLAVQKEIDANYATAREVASKLGRAHLSSGSRNPADRFEAVRGIRTALSDLSSSTRNNKVLFELTNNHRAFNEWEDKLKTIAVENKLNIDAREVDAMTKKYDDYTKDGSQSVKPSDFRLDKFTYDGAGGLARYNAAAKKFAAEYSEFETFEGNDGDLLERQITTTPGLDDLSSKLYEVFKHDNDLKALYENTQINRLKEDGETEYTYRDYLKDLTKAHARSETEEVRTTSKSTLRADEGTASGKNTKEEAKAAGTDNVLGVKVTDKTRSAIAAGDDILNRGGNVDGLSDRDWLKMGRLDDEDRLDIIQIDADGKEVPKGQPGANRIEVFDLGKPATAEEAAIPKKLIHTIPINRNNASLPINTTSNEFQTIEGLSIGHNAGIKTGGRNLGFATNNPVNIKGDPAKFPVTKDFDTEGPDDKVFQRVFPNMEAGTAAGQDLLAQYKNGKNATFNKNLKAKGKTGEDATLTDLYETWATGATPALIEKIANDIGVTPETKIDDIPVDQLFKGILSVENSQIHEVFYNGKETPAPATPTQAAATATAAAPVQTPQEIKLAQTIGNFTPFEESVIGEDLGEFADTPDKAREVARYIDDNNVDVKGDIEVTEGGLKTNITSKQAQKLMTKHGNRVDQIYNELAAISNELDEFNIERERVGAPVITAENIETELTRGVIIDRKSKKEDEILNGFEKVSRLQQELVQENAALSNVTSAVTNSPKVKAALIDKMIPDYADQSYDNYVKLVTDAAAKTPGGVKLEGLSVNGMGSDVKIRQSSVKDNIWFVEEPGKSVEKIEGMEAFKAYVKENLKEMAFDANPPTELRSQAILLETVNAEASRIEANRTAPLPPVPTISKNNPFNFNK
jgi:hypothetical protein